MYSMFMLENKCWMKHRWVVAWTYLQSMKTHWIRPYRDNFIVRHKQIQSLNSPSQIFLTTHRRTSISRYSIVFSLHRLSCSVLVDSLEEGFHVLYLHLDSHHVDPSKYTQHHYLTTVTVSWKADTCSNYKKCVHCSGTGKTTKNIMHASVISDVYFLRP